MSRDLFAHAALQQIPKILTLQDRNPHSPTYGCFDRNYWQYRIIDFPSGMSQEFVYPLALAYDADLPGNPFYRKPIILDWVRAGINYASESMHPDGSCDDYFPFERAGGAAAFSLLAAVESYQLLNFDDPQMRRFFEIRADWLAHHDESGRLTNHQALIVLGLDLVGRLLRTDKWTDARNNRLQRILDWQHDEGWFPEYEGADPGYQTLTIGCLGRVLELNPDDHTLRAAVQRAADFIDHFVHPDGSFGGEYTSRNTYNFFPHGFEIIGSWMPQALAVNDRFAHALKNGLAPCYADDHIVGHHTWSYLLAWRRWSEQRPPVKPRPDGRLTLPAAGLVIEKRGPCKLYLALNKGGVFKLFKNDTLICSDTQLSVRHREGKRLRNAVAHLVDTYRTEIDDDRITVAGDLGFAKQKRMTTFNLIVLRLIMLTVGRFFPNLIRSLLQKMLITGKQAAPYQFKREFTWADDGGQLIVRDTLDTPTWKQVASVGLGADQTSIYVVMSRTFQRGQMQPFHDLTDQAQNLADGQPLVVERTF